MTCPTAKAIHAEPRGAMWAVRRAGATRAIHARLSREEAYALAQEMATKKKVAAVLHDENGRVAKMVPA